MAYDEGTMTEETKASPIETLTQYMQSNNVAEFLDQNELDILGAKVIEDLGVDEESRAEWLETYEDALKLARQVREEKTHPWVGASNVKYPLVGQAAMNFNARAYPEIIQGDNVVKTKIPNEESLRKRVEAEVQQMAAMAMQSGDEQLGQQAIAAAEGDPMQDVYDRAERIAAHMNYQLMEEMPNWEAETDKLTMILPIVGTLFREVSFDEIDLKPDSCLMLPDELIVNYNSKSLELRDCRRISKRFTRFNNDIIERERAGLWLKLDYTKTDQDGEVITESQQTFIQQLRYHDIDKDGYEEPYIITVHEESSRVVRIVALYDETTVSVNAEGKILRIEPYRMYTDYHFIPAFDGGFYSTGFGAYLSPLNHSIDTLINQMIDSGTLNNMQSGFITKGARMRGGTRPLAPGEWRFVESKSDDFKNSLVPVPTKEPSGTLYNLLIFLIETGQKMSSVTDIMAGIPQGPNTPVGTTMAMIEQGMKEIDAIYKRVYRGLKREFKMLFRINRIHFDEKRLFDQVGNPTGVEPGDYVKAQIEIVPVGDPRVSTQMMKVIKAQTTRDVIATTPGGDILEATRRLLEAMDVSDVESLLPKGPDPQELLAQIEYMQGMVEVFQSYIETGQMEIAIQDANRRNREADASIQKDLSNAVKNIAEAEKEEVGQQLALYQAELARMRETHKQQMEIHQIEREARERAIAERVSGMGQQPGYAGGAQTPATAAPRIQ